MTRLSRRSFVAAGAADLDGPAVDEDPRPSDVRLPEADPGLEALDDLAAHTKRLVDLTARLHGADVPVRFLGLVVADLCRAHGSQRLGSRLVRAAR